MKKLVVLFAVLLALGAGCVQLGKLVPGQKEVAGDWYLAFTLPAGWVMVDDYNDPVRNEVALDFDIAQSDSEIVLQNVDKPIVFSSGAAPDESVSADSYVINEGTRITVTRLDPRRLVPSEAEDWGKGFFKLKLCEEGEDCQIGGAHNYEYYLVTENAKYKFEVNTRAADRSMAIDEAEDVIRSAKEVTTFTSQD